MVSHITGLEFEFDPELSVFFTTPCRTFQGFSMEVTSFLLEESRITLL